MRYFRFPPNVAHRKLTDLANYVPRFRPRGVMSFTQRFFKIWENDPYGWFATREYVASFAKNEYLYRQISTKYKSSKLFWKILEDNKQNKHENRGKKTVWILRADRRFVLVCSTCYWNATNSFPPSLSFLPSNPCLFWWIISANSCLLVFNSIIRWKPQKIKRLCNVNTWARRSCWNADHADCRLQTVQTVQYLYLYLNFLVP